MRSHLQFSFSWPWQYLLCHGQPSELLLMLCSHVMDCSDGPYTKWDFSTVSELVPATWNNIPATICDSATLVTFKTAFKTHLFNSAYTSRHWLPSIGASDLLFLRDIWRQPKKSMLIDLLMHSRGRQNTLLGNICDSVGMNMHHNTAWWWMQMYTRKLTTTCDKLQSDHSVGSMKFHDIPRLFEGLKSTLWPISSTYHWQCYQHTINVGAKCSQWFNKQQNPYNRWYKVARKQSHTPV